MLAVIVDSVVLGHDPLVLDIQTLGEMRAEPWDEGGPGFGGGYREALVVGGEKRRGQILVGRSPALPGDAPASAATPTPLG